MTDFKRIPPEQAQALRDQGAVVVDIRDLQAYAAVAQAHTPADNDGRLSALESLLDEMEIN